jgi:hypothetical protein
MDGTRAAADSGNGAMDAAIDDAHEDAVGASSPAESRTKGRRSTARSRSVATYEVSLWVTSLNEHEIGIYQHTRNRAKSRQFTQDMDLFGEVKEEGQQTGMLGYRRGIWKEKTGMEKRLVIKLFSGTLNWRGTLDLMLGRSMQLTHGARGLPVTSYSVNLDDHQQMIQLERSANKWPGLPENYSFFVLEDGRPRFYRLHQDLLCIGDDYTLYDENDRKVATLDGRVINLGGKWVVEVDPEHATARLNNVLQLFCGMLRFNDECLAHVGGLVHGMHRAKVTPKLESSEADLYMNPRRVR